MLHDVHMGHYSLQTFFTSAELSALRLSGEIDQYLEFWDEFQDWRSRSFHILREERHPLVLTTASAVWAMGLCSEPQTHVASTVTASRIRRANRNGLAIEERTLQRQDFWLSGSCGVTSPLRTISDLLRSKDAEDADVLDLCNRVRAAYCISHKQILESLLALNSVPNKRNALARALLMSPE